MNVIYFMIPITLLLSFGFVAAFIWATKAGQWNDLDTNPWKVLDEKDGDKHE